jgi:hypothetical protein
MPNGAAAAGVSDMDWLWFALPICLIIGVCLWYFRGPRDPDDKTPQRFGGGGRR